MKALRTRVLAVIVVPAYVLLALSGAVSAGSCCILNPCDHNGFQSHDRVNSPVQVWDVSHASGGREFAEHTSHAVHHHRLPTNDLSVFCHRHCTCSILPEAARSYIPSATGKTAMLGTHGSPPAHVVSDSHPPAQTPRGEGLSPPEPSFFGSALICLRTIVLQI